MDLSLSGVSMEKAASLKVEEMVNLFEKMDGKPRREVHQISMARIGSPAKTEDSRALVSIPQSSMLSLSSLFCLKGGMLSIQCRHSYT